MEWRSTKRISIGGGGGAVQEIILCNMLLFVCDVSCFWLPIRCEHPRMYDLERYTID